MLWLASGNGVVTAWNSPTSPNGMLGVVKSGTPNDLNRKARPIVIPGAHSKSLNPIETCIASGLIVTVWLALVNA